jgi:hypothetical protein
MKTTVRASITVEVEIPCHSSWSEDTTVVQITKQAMDDFNQTIYLLNRPSVVDEVRRAPHSISLVGVPKVNMIIIQTESAGK